MPDWLQVLLGVIVGGLITFGIQTWSVWQARQREKKVAARLVLVESREAWARLGWTILRQRWWPEPFDRSAWKAHAPSLAFLLDDREDWETVARAYVNLQVLEMGRAGSTDTLKTDALRAVREGRDSVSKAVQVLESHVE